MEDAEIAIVEADAARQKQAACYECRRSKTKCIRAPDDTVCKKCRQSSLECVVPEYHVGRYKGVKNKRSGLEKAIAQVEQAIKRSRTSGDGLNDTQAEALQLLLKESSVATSPLDELTSYRPGLQRARTLPSSRSNGTRQPGQMLSTGRTVSFTDNSDDSGEVVVNNADNPLQLLAIASTIPESSPQRPTTPGNGSVAFTDVGVECLPQDEVQAFFKPLRAKLDVRPDLDPIDLGLVGEDEAQDLFSYFHDKLAHTRWGMDMNLHTAAFVRSRSAFLFTSVVAASALFLPHTPALSKRLQIHVRRLAQTVISERYKSVEIVLAFMINIPWMIPGKHWTEDDETCYYLAMALTIALDLQLNKIITPSLAARSAEFMDRIALSNCILATKALATDGFDKVDPCSVMGKRLLRTRERTWLALFNLDRGACLARGRPPTVPIGPLLDSCDSWHLSDVPERQDGPLISATVLRRDIVGLITSIRSTCDSHRFSATNGTEVVKFLKDKIEKFFEHWLTKWSYQPHYHGSGIPPYVEILASHTKLSAYCNVINHPTAPADVKRFFRAAGLATALNVMRVAVQSEPRMKSMPNNTVIMVSFAACFVLGLGTSRTCVEAPLAPNAEPLIRETAEVLERIGSVPTHRRGASVLFGRHIKAILQKSKALRTSTIEDRTPIDLAGDRSIVHAIDNYAQEALHGYSMPPETSHTVPGYLAPESFSVFDMTDDQLLEAIANSKTIFDQPDNNFLYDENQFLNWFESWG